MATTLADRSNGGAARRDAGPRVVLRYDRDRIAYAGPLGKPSQRIQGSLTVYASLGEPFRLSLAGASWERAELAVVPPYVPHRFATDDRRIGILQLEAETIDLARLPPFLAAAGGFVHPALLARIRERLLGLLDGERDPGPPGAGPGAAFDAPFFGAPLPPRAIDPRIAAVVERLRSRPNAALDGATAAALAGLSHSRFLHLFKDELGAPFRRFRAWKRARSLLAHVPARRNLADFALEMGYPDATHFSHSIRAFYGHAPRDIFSGLRRLAVVSPVAPCR